jgi:predicted TIM-barrel fold metal-dependent hydrolase
MSEHRRIDVHQHIIAPDYRAYLGAHGIINPSGTDLPRWSPEGAIAVMDDNGVSTGVLSVSTPGVHLGDDAEASTMARRVNEFSAELVKDRPDRFGFFASLTLPDVAGSLTAVEYAFDELAADGVILLANVRGRYLGDAEFDPLLAELDARGAVVLIHPSDLPGPSIPGIGPAAADYLLDTTRTAIDLVRVGAVTRYPRIRFILAHAGGFLPYAAHRIAGWLAAYGVKDRPFRHDAAEATVQTLANEAMSRLDTVLDQLSGFYFDVALSSTPAALPSLLAFAKPGHVLYGSDAPFARDVAVRYYADGLDGYDLDDARRHAINRGSAETLFPRLA